MNKLIEFISNNPDLTGGIIFGFASGVLLILFIWLGIFVFKNANGRNNDG